MFDQLLELQARLQTMRDAVLKEGSVIPSEKERITIPKSRWRFSGIWTALPPMWLGRCGT